MAYEVLARKWRPQQFDELVGQGHIAQTLTNALQSERVAHAYLFVGPRGTGKTSTARILAKALNCEKGPTPTPCDECTSCREVVAGNHLDVLEIDGASNTGVDHVRELRENVKFLPARGPFKIYIIDEVHMLSTGAFNALLKTLEEPPAHVKFLFATTEPQKVPATILSRCQRFDFRRISTKDIVGRLTSIAEAEGVAIDAAALLAIARGAEGGMRDAQSALDQLIAFRGKTINEDDVLSVFGLVSHHTLDDLVKAILHGDVARLIDVIAELDQAGKDMQRLVLELLEYFRNLLVWLAAGENSAGLELTDVQEAALRELAVDTEAERVLRVVNALIEAESKMRYTLSKRTLVETSLVRCARAATVVGLGSVLEQLNELKAQLGGGTPAPVPAATSAQKKTPVIAEPPPIPTAPVASPVPAPAPEPEPEPKPSPEPAPPPSPEPPAVAPPEPILAAPVEPGDRDEDVQLLMDQWHDVVDRVGQVSPLARNYLLDAKPVSVKGDVVTIGFDPEFSDSKSKIDYPRNIQATERAMSTALGRSVTVSLTILTATDTLPGDTKFVRREEGKKPTVKTKDPERRRAGSMSRDEWVKEPVVQKALEMFNGDIVDIRE